MPSDEYLVVLAVPFSAQRYTFVRSIVLEACDRVSAIVGRPLHLADALTMRAETPNDVLKNVIGGDVMVADLTEENANVMIEVGLRLGTGKPFVLLAQDGTAVPFNLVHFRRLIYDERASARPIVAQLAEQLEHAVRHPESWRSLLRAGAVDSRTAATVFVSYSHVDAEYLTRLRVHLRPLEKLGLIELWDDTRIKSGEKWKQVIEAALKRAATAVLLISADFLASDFIVDNELPPLLRAAEETGTVVLPLILKPSRFARDPHLSSFQAVNDPARPLVMLPLGEQEALYAQLAERIEAMVGAAES